MAYFSSLPGTAKERKREKKGKRGRINEERDENNKRTEGEERRIEGKTGGSRVSSEEEMVKRMR